jgi:hypothetical protein
MTVRRFDGVLQWAQILMNTLEVNELAGSLVCRPDCRVVCMCVIRIQYFRQSFLI